MSVLLDPLRGSRQTTNAPPARSEMAFTVLRPAAVVETMTPAAPHTGSTTPLLLTRWARTFVVASSHITIAPPAPSVVMARTKAELAGDASKAPFAGQDGSIEPLFSMWCA